MAHKANSDTVIADWKGRTVAEMWTFIENTLVTYDRTPNRKDLTDQQICALYSRLTQVDEMFRELTQISMWKKEIRDMKKKLKS